MSTTNQVVDTPTFQKTRSTVESEPEAVAPLITIFLTPRYPLEPPTSLLVNTTLLPSAPVEMSWLSTKSSERSSVQMGVYGIILYIGAHDLKLAERVKLARLKAIHFKRKGREERIARALSTLDAPGPIFSLDDETWEWIAQETDLEDL